MGSASGEPTVEVRTNVLARAAAINDDQLRAMGRVIVNWSVLENHVSIGIGTLLGATIGQVLALLVPVRSFRQRRDMLVHVFKETWPDKQAAFGELLSIMKTVDVQYAVRNRVAHGVWGIDDDENAVSSAQFNLKIKTENDWTVHKLSAAEMNTHAVNMLETATKLGKFLHGHQHYRIRQAEEG